MSLGAILARFGRKGTIEFWMAVMAGAALAATVGVVFYALNHLANEVDRTDRALTRQTAQAAVKSFVKKLHDSHQDYARWDDAVTGLYNISNPEFVRSGYTDSTSTGIIFDTAFLIDESGKDLFALRAGAALAASSKEISDWCSTGCSSRARRRPANMRCRAASSGRRTALPRLWPGLSCPSRKASPCPKDRNGSW
ncbi:hypothetical protein G5V57_27885 [Nordella sp. HKS 07]|uniref:CHASE4 domain-containing protein n=1 Tax=Nordella sp. HKS 07 TaxID=2712222 RepID=UPI0013E16FA0|nr:CHASE4 domain-containing protein [Nordella sp. HKS 07]QIG51206.1 hypothetical protein G5V57_27885 [Nordella sp. HKS 07]